jgi:methyl-accepting chemotaxis protein
MSIKDPQFWMMIASIITAICFIFMVIALGVIAIVVKKVSDSVKRLEERVNPVIGKVGILMEKVTAIGEQGRLISEQFTEMSKHLSSATRNFSESTELIKEEIAELKELVGHTAIVAKDKVELVGETVDRVNAQVTITADFIQRKVVEPAREIAAIMAGIRKGLEVLLAPAPKPIDKVYSDEELFIG